MRAALLGAFLVPRLVLTAQSAPAGEQAGPLPPDRLGNYVRDTFGPVALFRASVGAAWSQARNRPPEWGQGFDAYGRRVASQYGELVIQESVRHGLGALLGEDIRYRRCECRGFVPRFGHAWLSTLTVSSNGRYRPSIAKLVAPFAGTVGAVTLWYPDRFTYRDGLRFGVFAVAGAGGTNVLREFFGGRATSSSLLRLMAVRKPLRNSLGRKRSAGGICSAP
jgi:hypothetical protein